MTKRKTVKAHNVVVRTTGSGLAIVGEYSCAGAAVVCETTASGLRKAADLADSCGQKCRAGEARCHAWRESLQGELDEAEALANA